MRHSSVLLFLFCVSSGTADLDGSDIEQVVAGAAVDTLKQSTDAGDASAKLFHASAIQYYDQTSGIYTLNSFRRSAGASDMMQTVNVINYFWCHAIGILPFDTSQSAFFLFMCNSIFSPNVLVLLYVPLTFHQNCFNHTTLTFIQVHT
jgi:hypothetical protein